MITLYSTGCPNCRALKKKLDAAHIPYTVVGDVDVMLGLGIKSIPVLKVGEELLPFEQAVKYVDEHKEDK